MAKKRQDKIGYPTWWYKFIKPLLGVGMSKKFNVEFEYEDGVFKLEAPYFVCPNHVSFWDPFIVNTGLPPRIHYLISDANFVNPIRKAFLGLTGGIPKAKSVSDMSAVRKMVRVIKAGRCVGVYPEGKRTWDGKTLPLFYSASKMIKSFKIPVVVPISKGMFLSNPRWGNKPRIGKVKISYHIELTTEEIEKLSVDEIHARLTKVLAYNEYDYQREVMVPYKSKNPAEYLEKALYVCPHCKTIGKTRSKKDRFFCEECGYEVRYNEYGFFEPVKEKLYFDNIADWNKWQLDFMRKLTDKAIKSKSKKPIFSDTGVLVKRGQRGLKRHSMTKFRNGSMLMYYDHIFFITHKNEEIRFDVEKIKGMNVPEAERLEFYYDDVLYRISYKMPVSSLKWMRTLHFLQKPFGITEEGSLA